MQAIQTVTVGSGGQSSITFSSIPDTYTDLVVLCSLRSNRTAEVERLTFRFNGDSGSNYSYKALIGTGSSKFSEGITTNGIISYAATGNTATANTFGNLSLYIPNYLSSNQKSTSQDGVFENNATNAWQNIMANRWTGTAPINSITVTPDFGTLWLEHSTATLYGILAGSDGTTTVTT